MMNLDEILSSVVTQKQIRVHTFTKAKQAQTNVSNSNNILAYRDKTI